MRSAVGRWGHSLAVRIPKGLADEAGLKEGAPVEIVPVEGGVTIRSVARPKYRLRDLVKSYRATDRNAEVDWGRPRGKEVW